MTPEELLHRINIDMENISRIKIAFAEFESAPFRQNLSDLLLAEDKYKFHFAKPCSTGQWVLVVIIKS